MTTTQIAIFKGKEVRKTIHNDEWWFVINDVIEILTDSADPAQYFKRLRQRDEELAKLTEKGGVQFVPPLMLEVDTAGGNQKMYCWNTEGIFRLIQSIPSPKAEPFKRWLAKVGYERMQEIENPELATRRTRMLYKLKGYSNDWIEKRMRGIAIREELTDEWKKRGARERIDYAILTNDIMKGAFDLTVEDYKKLKGLKRQNLRDHMEDIELILTMLGEATTAKLTKDRDSKGVPKLRRDAKDGGAVAGRTRLDIEKRSSRKVISGKNFLPKRKNKKLLKPDDKK
ncbi:MAG: DNA protein [Patescibacteria group bacterium]|nr:DNA protein [Patescibacteria group bacterium]